MEIEGWIGVDGLSIEYHILSPAAFSFHGILVGLWHEPLAQEKRETQRQEEGARFGFPKY
jgi:hypothetical protein